VLESLSVGKDDFYGALNEIEPSAIREVCVEIPDTDFDDIGGLGGVKDEIVKSVVWPQQYR
jgi:transitional endoplasmic reticulum ATPase